MCTCVDVRCVMCMYVRCVDVRCVDVRCMYVRCVDVRCVDVLCACTSLHRGYAAALTSSVWGLPCVHGGRPVQSCRQPCPGKFFFYWGSPCGPLRRAGGGGGGGGGLGGQLLNYCIGPPQSVVTVEKKGEVAEIVERLSVVNIFKSSKYVHPDVFVYCFTPRWLCVAFRQLSDEGLMCLLSALCTLSEQAVLGTANKVCMVWVCMVWVCMVWVCIVWVCMVWVCMVWVCMVWVCIVWVCMVWVCMVWVCMGGCGGWYGCICAYVYGWVCMYLYVYRCICVSVCVCTCTLYVCICVYVCVYGRERMCVFVCGVVYSVM